jgi:hypothetical protein
MDDILKGVCGFLNKEGINYVIVGGLAVIFHGIPRTTMDADIILHIEEKKMSKFVEFLKENGFFASLEDMKTAFKEKTHYTVEDRESMLRLDIKGVYNELDRWTLNRKIDFAHKGVKIYLASPEDIIANKLVYGSEQDLQDAAGIYTRQLGRLDMAYLMDICREMDVLRDFEKLKRRVKESLRKIKTDRF